jgi:uncharacterized membrane protein HdeD (DUF308 family)
MNKGIVFRFFGAIFLIIGVTVMFNSFQSITGYAVYGGVDIDKGYIIGAWFVLTGIVLAVYRRKEKR